MEFRSGGYLAPSLGRRKIFSADPRFLNDVFGDKFPFLRQKFLMIFFLVIDQIFKIFPFFFQIFPILAMLNVIRQHYFSKYWGWDQCMGTSNFGGPSPLGSWIDW